jgi:hypothetical protein
MVVVVVDDVRGRRQIENQWLSETVILKMSTVILLYQ